MKRRTAQLVGALALAGLTGTAFAGDQGSGATANLVRLEEATMIVEVDSTVGDAGVQFFLDGEPWRSITISAPNGRTLGHRRRGSAEEPGPGPSSSPRATSRPSTRSGWSSSQRFPEGRYTFVGETIEGDRVIGSARLSHDIPEGPAITSPEDLSAQTGVVARWSGPPEPPGIDIVGYRVIVTREDPLRIYSVDLPASARR